jgi:hypothetical protein
LLREKTDFGGQMEREGSVRIKGQILIQRENVIYSYPSPEKTAMLVSGLLQIC